MKIRSAILVYKKSNYQIRALERKEPHFLHLLRAEHPTVSHSRRVHEEHTDVLREVKAILDHLQVPYRSYPRYALQRAIRADLVITVGGDGTYLETSHYVSDSVMFGVNSNPDDSVGHFCTATVANFEKKINQLLKGKIRPKKLQRLQATIDGRKVGSPVLNEILFAHSNPAAMSRYLIGTQKTSRTKKINQEEQRGSGVWVAAPMGSTAAIRSAGGPRLAREAKRFAYQVREPQQLSGQKYRLLRGILEAKTVLHLTPKMEEAAIFIDGAHESYPVPRGHTVSIRLSEHPLRVIK